MCGSWPRNSDLRSRTEDRRKGCDAVGRETEGMTLQEMLAYFDKAVVRQRFEAALREAEKDQRQ